MINKTINLTMAEAVVKFLQNQWIEIDGEKQRLFAGVMAIFGHGNVTCFGHALESVQDELPTYRGQNEQTMAHAAIGFAKANRRRRIMVATSSIGPGATNMVTAAAVAHANRLPLLIISGDYFNNRIPNPVLQQVENFYDPTISVNDCFKPVTRYWDRITHPAQIMNSFPQAVATMLDPASCGPAFIGLCQDVQEIAYDYPEEFFAETIHHIPRQLADTKELNKAIECIKSAKKLLIIAGGGIHYSKAELTLGDFAKNHNIPVIETVAGKSSLVHSHPCLSGPIGVTGSDGANYLAENADVILAIGTRLQDFTTGSWSNFDEQAQFISLNTARFDATKHKALSVVGDAKLSLEYIEDKLKQQSFDKKWLKIANEQSKQWDLVIDNYVKENKNNPSLLHYGQVIDAVANIADKDDYMLAAAGGYPSEINKIWRSKAIATFDCEYGFSCMGYEIAAGWGAKIAKIDNDVFVFVGDGSYLMNNSDIYSSVLTGTKVIIMVGDNGGYSVINRLQNNKGGKSFNNQIVDSKHEKLCYVDFVEHAKSMGALTTRGDNIKELKDALIWAKNNDTTTVIVSKIDPFSWSPGGCWWDVGVPETSTRKEVVQARKEHKKGRLKQRKGV